MTNLSCSLDAAVHQAADALRRRGVTHVDVVYSMATGLGLLPSGLDSPVEVSLAELPGAPEEWAETTLVFGELGGVAVCLFEDPAGDPAGDHAPVFDSEAWIAGFPIWLCAALGAFFCTATAAGVVVAADRADELCGKLALVGDHLNLSGRTPLIGIGDSHLGPLFPDLTDLHHKGLRDAALSHAAAMGIPATEVVCACTLGPSLLTQAERTFCARAGADIAVQGLATPILAAAHAGLSVMALVAVTDAGDGVLDIRRLVSETEALAPAVDDLLLALAGEIDALLDDLREDG